MINETKEQERLGIKETLQPLLEVVDEFYHRARSAQKDLLEFRRETQKRRTKPSVGENRLQQKYSAMRNAYSAVARELGCYYERISKESYLDELLSKRPFLREFTIEIDEKVKVARIGRDLMLKNINFTDPEGFFYSDWDIDYALNLKKEGGLNPETTLRFLALWGRYCWSMPPEKRRQYNNYRSQRKSLREDFAKGKIEGTRLTDHFYFSSFCDRMFPEELRGIKENVREEIVKVAEQLEPMKIRKLVSEYFGSLEVFPWQNTDSWSPYPKYTLAEYIKDRTGDVKPLGPYNSAYGQLGDCLQRLYHSRKITEKMFENLRGLTKESAKIYRRHRRNENVQVDECGEVIKCDK